MIPLLRLNQTPFYLNVDLIEQIEATPDTVITLSTGSKLTVAESVADLVQRINDFRRQEGR
jgi:flagellar protein FlbD